MVNLPRLSTIKHYSTYLLTIVFIARGVLTIIFLYQYIIFSSSFTNNKGGSFVEAITEPISYLPYWGDLEKNKFYQTLLFPGCEGGLGEDICTITTDNDQDYYLSINQGITRSDGTPFTIDDVLFSYKDIVIDNFWKQPYLSSYQDITISFDEENPERLIIHFAKAKETNRNFFKLPIIPLHILQDYTLEQYVTEFAKNPITLGCAKLQHSKDTNSIVFNVSNCSQTKINYYQIKSFASIAALQHNINLKDPLVGFYHGFIESPSFELLGIKNNFFSTFFFNTQSTKLTPRIQRSIAGFISDQFWQENHTGYLSHYEGLFNHYLTTGDHLADYIEEKNPYLTYDKSLLEQGGVHALPKIFTIDRAQRKYAFYLDPQEQESYQFSVSTPDAAYNVTASSNQSVRNIDVHSSEDRKTHRLQFTIGEGQQIKEGLNVITIQGTVLEKKQTIATISLYYLGRTSLGSGDDNLNKIKIIMIDNNLSNYIKVQLQNIFVKNNLQNLFQFVSYKDTKSLLEAIDIKDYDIVLTTIQMKGLADIFTILSSNDPHVNPSRYTKPTLLEFLKDNNRDQVRNMIAADQPFFILGENIEPYWLRKDINLNYTGVYNQSTIRDVLLQHISLVRHRVIHFEDLFKKNNFLDFLTHSRINSGETQPQDEFISPLSGNQLSPDERDTVLKSTSS